MQPLPIDSQIPDLLETLGRHRTLVLLAEPGAGKTTRVPPAMVRAGLCAPGHPRILVLQPRRVAARAIAQRIGDEQGWSLGEQVGYQVRMERKFQTHTPLVLITEGILTRRLLTDPLLEGVGAVVLDEFHERSIHSDVALAMLKQVRQTVRPDLLILVMSATLDPQPISRFLDNAPVLNVPGRLFPVTIQYAPGSEKSLEERIVAAVQTGLTIRDASTPLPGHILVFLPGAGEIDRCMKALAGLAKQFQAIPLPLHGSLPLEMQLKALAPAERKKIILSTNIAETSLTIDGVGVVVDSGLVRRAGFDADRGIDRLDLQRISKASATQRAGRAGRTGPGLCIRLWSMQENNHLADFDPPEIQRLDLTPTVLSLYSWDRRGPAGMDWLTAPPAQRVSAADQFLLDIRALAPIADGGQTITPLGNSLLNLPLHPRLGNFMLTAAQFGLTRPAALLAAMLSEKDILASRAGRTAQTTGDSDILWRLDLLTGERTSSGAHDHALDAAAVGRVRTVAAELQHITASTTPQNASRPQPEISDDSTQTRLRKLLLTAYPDRVCRRRATDPTRALMVGGRGVRLAPDSIVKRAEFFLAVDMELSSKTRQNEALVRQASAIEPAWLSQQFPHAIEQRDDLTWDGNTRRITAQRTILYHDLPLGITTGGPRDTGATRALLRRELGPVAQDWIMENSQCAQLLLRFNFLQHAMPDKHWPLPEVDFPGDPAAATSLSLADILAEWLASQAAATGRVDELLLQDSLADRLLSSWNYATRMWIDKWAPPDFKLPGGRVAQLQYRADAPPILAARVQELFGLHETPRIADGRVALTLEILGPNYRPVQTTADLAGFWRGSYHQIRKDLRARYPKHNWPEEPLKAVAKPMRLRT